MSHVLKWLLCYWPIIFTSIKLILNREGTLELPYLCRDLENYLVCITCISYIQDQYILCHEVVVDYLDAFEEYSNFKY